MKLLPRLTVVLSLLAGLATATPIFAISESEAKAGREILSRYADAIIGVEMVVVIKGMAGDRPLPTREQPRDINGTVVNANGLTVISLSAIDPRGGGLMVPPNVRIDEPEFKEVKLRHADGTEVPAQIVLKDVDLDLAFVAPLDGEASRPFTPVDLDQPEEGELLGTYFELARAAKAMQRAPAVRVVHISGVVERPRRMYLLSDYAPGCPVFAADGRLLGVTVRFTANDRAVGNVLLPAEDIAEVARQAAAIKPSAPAPSEEASTE